MNNYIIWVSLMYSSRIFNSSLVIFYLRIYSYKQCTNVTYCPNINLYKRILVELMTENNTQIFYFKKNDYA